MKRGFTLVELIIVVGIVALISSLTLANFPSFKGRLAVDREVSKIGLALRKAQQYSSGVRRFDDTISTAPVGCTKGLYEAQYPAYGLSVSINNPQEYDIYADPDCSRISGDYTNDLVESMVLDTGISITDICVNIDSGAPTCALTSLDVWYVRPNPTLVLTANGSPPDASLQSAKIIIQSREGSKKSVVIRKTGQISVQNEP